MSYGGGGEALGVRGLLGRIALTWIAAVVAVVAVAVSGLFGGLDRVSNPDLRTVAVDELLPGSPWNVKVTGARISGELEPMSLSDKANHFIAILAEIEVTSNETRIDIEDVLRLDGVPGLVETDRSGRPADVVIYRDATPFADLHPGLPELVAFFWEQQASEPPPTELDVLIYGKTERRDTLTNHLSWLDDTAVAKVRVPVIDRR